MRRSRSRVAVVLTGTALAGLAGPVVTPARAAEGEAYAAGLNYATPALVVAKGDALRFNNIDSLAQHDLVSDQPGQFSSPLIGGGQAAPVNGVDALPPGTYAFHCSLHPWMHGELTVAAAGGGPGPPSPPQGPPSPPSGGSAPNPADLLPAVAPSSLDTSAWPFYGGNLSNARDGGSRAPSYNQVPTLGPVWTFQSTDGDFTGTPVVASGTLVAAAGGGSVFAIDAATGKLRWTHDFNQPINATAAIVNGRVFVPLAKPGQPTVAALDLATGAELWQTTVDTQKDSDVYGSPVVWSPPGAAASAAPGAQKRSVHRRATRRHHRRAKARRRPQRGTSHPPQPAAIRAGSPDTVYIGVSALFGELNDPAVNVRGAVVALDAGTGAIRWKTYTVPPGHDGGAVWTTPAIDTDTGRLFVGTGNAYHAPAADTTDSVLALDARTGQIAAHIQATANDVWNETSSKASGPDYDFGASPNLFTGPSGQRLVGDGQKSGTYWAFDRATLRPVWSAFTGPGTPVVGGIVGSTATDGHLIYGPDTAGGELWALTRDGKQAWVSSDGGPLQFSAVSAGNGVVYTTDMSGTLTAREAMTGVVLAKLPLGAPSWGGVALAGGSVFAVTGTEGSSGWVAAYRPRG